MKIISGSPPPYGPHYTERGLMFKGYSWTSCKESIASNMMSGNMTVLHVLLQKRNTPKYTAKELGELEKYLNHKSKKMGFKNVKLSVYTDKLYNYYMDTSWKYIKLEIDKRWLTNSVVATMFMTFLRKKMYVLKGINSNTDKFHLKTAKWLIRRLYDGDKKLLLTAKSHRYDYGFVQLASALKRGLKFQHGYCTRYVKVQERYTLAQKNKKLFRQGLLRRGSKSKNGVLWKLSDTTSYSQRAA